MIIFYYKRTGEIIGTIWGRIHDKDIIDNSWIQTSSVSKKEVGKYVIPFKPVKEIVKQPITEMRVVDKKTGKVENVVVGHKKVKKTKEWLPDVPFKKIILEIENDTSKINQYRVDVKNQILVKK